MSKTTNEVAEAYLIEAQEAGMIGDDDWQGSVDNAFFIVNFGDGRGVVEYTAAEIVAKLDPDGGFFNRPGPDRWFVVVVTGEERLWATSHRQQGPRGPFSGEWGLLNEAQADAIVEAINADPAESGTAHTVEVFRWDNDQTWPEEYA